MTSLAEQLAPHYTRARVGDRLLLTGHSHQAWPDCAVEGQLEAFEDATAHVDEKWDRAFAKADEVREGFRGWLGDPTAELALGSSTHELVLRFLSALDLKDKPRLVTTDGEFHTLRRQLARLREEGLDVVVEPVGDPASLSARLAKHVDDRTAAVLVSAVLFETSRIVPDLGGLAQTCQAHEVELLVDAYHALGPVPFATKELGLDQAWLVGGGYKYLQLGEGNCFLRVPAHADAMRPVITGWYAEFADLHAEHDDHVGYGNGAVRFAGSTYDPTSHYRAARVMGFFAEQGLTPGRLRESYQHQLGVLADAFDALALDPVKVDRDRHASLSSYGGFLALRSAHAETLQQGLKEVGVLTDSRGSWLRFGPAPYLRDDQLAEAVARLGQVVSAL